MSASTPFPSPEIGEGAGPKKRILWKGSFVVTAALLLVLMWQCGAALYLAYKSGVEAVGHFYAQLNEDRYDEICSEADEGFSQPAKHDELLHFLEKVHGKLGNAGVATQLHVNVNATNSRTFVTSQITMQFEQGQADETSPGGKDGSSLKLYRYNVQSSAFLE